MGLLALTVILVLILRILPTILYSGYDNYNPNNSSQRFSFLQSLLLLIFVISCLFHVQPLHFKGRKLRREKKNRSIFPTVRQLLRGNFYPSPKIQPVPNEKPRERDVGKGNSIHFAWVTGRHTHAHLVAIGKSRFMCLLH